MRTLTKHGRSTADIPTIDRYVQGIHDGWKPLWTAMHAGHTVLSYATLDEAITGAEVGEAKINILKTQESSSSYSRSSHSSVNHLYSMVDDNPFPPRSPVTKKRGKRPSSSTLVANGFVYKPVTEEGRYKLTETQMRALYDEERCYHCYKPRHQKMGQCSTKMPVAPEPLN